MFIQCMNFGIWLIDLNNGQQKKHYLLNHNLPSIYFVVKNIILYFISNVGNYDLASKWFTDKY